MNIDFIKEHCINCSEHFDESVDENDWSGHFCWLEVYGNDRCTNPSIDEMSECPLNKINC